MTCFYVHRHPSRNSAGPASIEYHHLFHAFMAVNSRVISEKKEKKNQTSLNEFVHTLMQQLLRMPHKARHYHQDAINKMKR